MSRGRVVSPFDRFFAVLFCLLGTIPAQDSAAQGNTMELDAHCTVSALNRSAPVDDEGTWVLPNVPTTLGRVRIRATCVLPDGSVRHGQSDFVEVPANGVIEVADISFEAPTPSPTVLALTAPTTELSSPGQTVAIAVGATYPDGSTAEVGSDPGTGWTTTNAGILDVSTDGTATAVSSGLAIVAATHDGATGFLRFQVALSVDADQDGLPDDWELANGLDPNDPLDALVDNDLDGLTSLQEFQSGTDPNRADTDDDGLQDGDEISRGTDPLLRDSDGDRVPDGLEVQADSDPRDRMSVNLPPILDSLTVAPSDFTLNVNEAFGEGSRQLTVTATLIDGTSLDATGPPYGTSFMSSDLSIVSFGLEPGRVFGGVDGVATVTAANGAATADVVVTVEVVSPTPLGRVGLLGCANALDVSGSRVYVASSRPALAVIDASDLSNPVRDSYLWLNGSSMDVAHDGDHVFLAMHTTGVAIVNVADPVNPLPVGEAATSGPAWGIALDLPWIYVATDQGVSVIDASDLANPFETATLNTPGAARDLDLEGDLLAVADGDRGVALVDVSNPQAPDFIRSIKTSAAGSSRTAAVALRAGRAWTAEGRSGLGGLRSLRVEDPGRGTLIGSSSDRFGLNAIALDGPIALASDFFFVNSVPIFDISGPTPIFRTTIDFPGDPNGHDVKVAQGVVYSAAGAAFNRKPNCRWGGVLQIGRYAEVVGEAPPEVEIVTPASGDSVPERHPFQVEVLATDDVRVTEVELFLNGASVGLDTASPYVFDVPAPASGTPAELVALARDGDAGNQSESDPVSLVVSPDGSPVARIVSPPTGSEMIEDSSITVVVEADDDLQLVEVELLVDGVSAGTRSSSPASFTVTAPLGSTELILEARATDNLPQTAASESMTVTVNPDPPPAMGFVEPLSIDSAVAGGLLQVRVGATDNRDVDRVELKVDGVSNGEITAPPFTWVIPVPVGQPSLLLEAEAWDDLGNSSTDSLTLPILVGATTTLTGQVADPLGSPLAGAEVRCGNATVTAGVDGVFTVTDFPADGIGVLCEVVLGGTPDLVGQSAFVPPVPLGTTDLGLIALAAPMSVAGTGGVFGQDLSPLFLASDAELNDLLRWNEFQQGQPTGMAFNLDGGLWQLRTFTAGEFTSGKGGGLSFSRLEELDPGTAETFGEPELIVTPNPGAAVIDLAVDPGSGGLYGMDHVLFEGGSRLLSINPETGDAAVVGTLPAYTSAGLDFDSRRRLWVVAESGGNWQLYQVDPNTGFVLTNLALPQSGTVAGVSWHPPSDSFLVASEDSIYSFTTAPPAVTLWSTPSGQTGSGELIALAVSRGGVAAATATFTGRVIDDFGTPQAGLDVFVLGASTTTAADGTFTLEAVPRTERVRVIAKSSNDHAFSQAVIPIVGGTVDVGDIQVLSSGGEG